MEKENKKNGGYIFVIIILLIIVGVLGYLYVNKDLGDKTNCDIKEKETKEEKSSEIKEKNNETKDYAIKYDLPNDLSECFKDEKDILDRNIKVLTISANGLIITRLFEDENAKLTKEEKLKLIYNYLTDYFHMATTGVNDLDTDSNKQELSGDIIRGMYYLVFGEKIDSLMDLSGCPQYRYDSKNDVVYRIVNCGGTGYRTLTYRNVAYGRKDDELYVYQKALFTGDGMHYDIDGKESVQYIENATEDEYFYKYQDKIKTYKYTFKEVFGGIYQFISLEEVK